jgi:hypothetical protein
MNDVGPNHRPPQHQDKNEGGLRVSLTSWVFARQSISENITTAKVMTLRSPAAAALSGGSTHPTVLSAVRWCLNSSYVMHGMGHRRCWSPVVLVEVFET